MEIFTDIRDEQKYKTVKIGSQIWFAENLKFIHPTGSWAYNNDLEMEKIYGRLYTWEAAKAACPAGWHIPTDEEWQTLIDYLGGENVAGSKLKETGISHWQSPNEGATNESGFTALPGGDRYYNGTFSGVGYYGYWWSATEYGAADAWSRCMYYSSASVNRHSSYEAGGFSIRCVRD